jgi:hypothetical protein
MLYAQFVGCLDCPGASEANVLTMLLQEIKQDYLSQPTIGRPVRHT